MKQTIFHPKKQTDVKTSVSYFISQALLDTGTVISPVLHKLVVPLEETLQKRM